MVVFDWLMVVFDWLKEWSPVLTLGVAVLIAVVVFLLQRRVLLRARMRNEIDELMDWDTEAWELANEYFLGKIVTQNLKDRTRKLIARQFKLEIVTVSLGSRIKRSFADARTELGFLNRQFNQIDLKDNETPWGLTDEFQKRFFEAFLSLLQELVTLRRKT